MRSLQLRLILLVALGLAVGGLLLWQLNARESRHAAAADIDQRLQRAAEALMLAWYASARSDADLPAADAAATEKPTGQRVLPAFELRTLSQRVVLRSTDFPEAGGAKAGEPGFYSLELDDGRWRLLTVVDRQRELISRVAFHRGERERREAALQGYFNRPLLLTLPLIALLCWLALLYGLRPLRQLSRDLSRRSASDLGPLRLRSQWMVEEVQLLVGTLNDLFSRLRDAVRSQRVFTSAAGHELRNPLAGLRSQLDLARRAPSAEQRERAHERIAETADRMEALTGRLLRLARLDSARVKGKPQDVAAMIRDRASGQDRLRLSLAGEPVRVAGDAELLDALIANLIDNALRHSSAAATVDLELTATANRVRLTLTNPGERIAADERERVFEPFYRGREATGAGSGLGLALVKAIAKAHGGDAQIIDAPAGQTRLQVVLPRHGTSAPE